MSANEISQAVAVEVIKQAADALRAAGASNLDHGAVASALAEACRVAGVSPDAFDAAVASDPNLEHLKTDAIREALAGGRDPGPYASISRESPSGQPGDLTKERSGDPELDPLAAAHATQTK